MIIVDFLFFFSVIKISEGVFLQLKLKSVINRENIDYYELIIVVVDGGLDFLIGSFIVNVEVGDENDNFLQFYRDVYDVSLREDRDVGF